MDNLDAISKPITQIEILNTIIQLDGLDVYFINEFKKDTKHYKHKLTNKIISVEEFFIRFRRNEESFNLYSNGEIADNYVKICV